MRFNFFWGPFTLLLILYENHEPTYLLSPHISNTSPSGCYELSYNWILSPNFFVFRHFKKCCSICLLWWKSKQVKRFSYRFLLLYWISSKDHRYNNESSFTNESYSKFSSRFDIIVFQYFFETSVLFSWINNLLLIFYYSFRSFYSRKSLKSKPNCFYLTLSLWYM